jgi:tRNA(fMet)-specific endonuclease VapC
MIWILDTDHVSLFQRRDPIVTPKIQSTSPALLAITVVTYEEQIRGRLKVISRSSSDIDQLIFGYRKLNETLNFYRTRTVLEFNASAAVPFRELLRQKIRIGTQDLRIAAIALAIDGTVVTRNQRDFQRVPGLRTEDWSI